MTTADIPGTPDVSGPHGATSNGAGPSAESRRPHPVLNAYRVGLRRGLTSARIQLTTPTEVLGNVITIGVFVGALFFLQRVDVAGAEVSLGAMSMPGLIAMCVLFGAVMGIAGVLAMDRTNGTLLRAKSVPRGTTSYLMGEILANGMVTLVLTIAMLVTGLALFDGLVFDTPGRWLLFALVLLTGLIATLSIGAMAGALVNSPKNMGFVMLPIFGLAGISGIFYPLLALPVWLQWIAQVFPLYWFGLGLRASLLPDTMAAVEVGGSWRIELVFVMLLVWAVIGLVLAPRLLARMARRESGSAVAERRRGFQEQLGV